ncbi:hypothetical protein STCU_00253 [Strigomonas culicis]|uniref:Nodulin-like domain-containing protein n=1 Tax=Strigomonas culicis TaxID=28005 RepID=S9V7M7_9TRYP|nr:hypothetical protein STCU_00253 [Strigomonas culicis]|eukprot:EPY37044.1 hypothetical protein STCU_00253 [Strigomonas culicis]
MQSHTVAQIETLDLTNQKRINEVHRFSLLVIGAICCICSSFTYAFNLISVPMRDKYNLTQRDLCTISSVGVLFLYFALPYAFIFDHFGPVPVAAIATIIYPIGTICLALTFMNAIEGSVLRLTVFNAMMCAGCIQFDLISLMATISYFPTHKGYVTGMLKTFTGLGQALVGTIYIGFFAKETDRYFFFLAASAVAVGVLSMLFLRLPPYHLTGYQMSHLSLEEKAARERTKAQYLAQKPPMWRFIWGFALIGFFTIYLPVQSIITAFANVNHTTEIVFAVIAVFGVLVFAGMCLPWTACCGTSRPDSTAEEAVGKSLTNEPHDAYADGNEGSSRSVAVEKKMPVMTDLDYIAPQYSTTFFQNLLSTELWAIFWSLFVVVGAQLVVIFNAAYILGALMGESPTDEVRTLLTVINGTVSAIGRIIMAAFEVYTQNRKAEDRIPITIALFPPTCAVLLALILFLVLPGNLSLLLPFILIALGNGILNSAVVLTTRTIYAKDPAKHYNFCFLAMAISAIVFMRGLYGEWYSNQAEKNGSSLVCYGRSCVQTPLIVLACLSATALATTIYVHLRYRAFSNRTLSARADLHEEGERYEEERQCGDEVAVYSAEPIDEHKEKKTAHI